MEDFSEQELEKWAKEQLENGYSEEQIRDSLQDAGHDPEVVSHLFPSKEPSISGRDNGEKRFTQVLTVFAALALGLSGFMIGDYINPGLLESERSAPPIDDCSSADLNIEGLVVFSDEAYITYSSTHQAAANLQIDGERSLETVLYQGDDRRQRVSSGNFTKLEASFNDCPEISDQYTVSEQHW